MAEAVGTVVEAMVLRLCVLNGGKKETQKFLEFNIFN